MEIPKDLKDEIWQYCMLNDITDINNFIIKMLKQGYNIEKYGLTPLNKQKEVEIIEKEIIKEVERIVEVPVEVIKEVERIVEVPVEIIKEVIVEKFLDEYSPKEVVKEVIKEVVIKDDNEVIKLKQDIENLKIELELEKNRNYQRPKRDKVEEPTKNILNNVINWVSKTERGGKDIYGE